ncbi:MAG: hypothetical protein K5696_05205 [Lachnospiraceae bacterium]|nr:hypothetical protein [Lachnospiraceae bacterium]
MRIFEIYNDDIQKDIGTLLFFEKEKSFIVELRNDIDTWDATVFFHSFVDKGIFTLPRDISLAWVRERVIPDSRQNIGDILRNSRLREYDEMKLLELSEGRCSQDHVHIRRLREFPDYVTKRQEKNLKDVCLPGDGRLLCFFADDAVKEIHLTQLSEVTTNDDISKILRNRALYDSGKVGTGGYFVTFNDSIDIPAGDLYRYGKDIPLRADDFITFARQNMIDTNESCKALQCTRQNLAYLVSQKQLTAVKENVRGNLYLKGDVIRNTWG